MLCIVSLQGSKVREVHVTSIWPAKVPQYFQKGLKGAVGMIGLNLQIIPQSKQEMNTE